MRGEKWSIRKWEDGTREIVGPYTGLEMVEVVPAVDLLSDRMVDVLAEDRWEEELCDEGALEWDEADDAAKGENRYWASETLKLIAAALPGVEEQ